MAIRITVARSAKEIDDALWLRHEVFVIEDGKFGGQPLPGERMVDRYDAFPHVYNVVTYDGDEPIATIRLVRESTCGSPVDHLYDFSNFRASVSDVQKEPKGEELNLKSSPAPVFGSAGMLAIREKWRRRRDVIRAMFRMAAAVCRNNGATHVLVVVNHETAGMYRRLGFKPLSGKYWVEEIENEVIPLATSTETFIEWALGGLDDTPLSPFEDSFERQVLRSGEVIFEEGDVGDHAFVIESGNVRISRRNELDQDLTLAHLIEGDLFGELALVDNNPRSATATATTDTELITLSRAAFLKDLQENPERSRELFKIFSLRIRHMDELAIMLAFAPHDQRMEFALQIVRRRAIVDRKNPDMRMFRGGAAEFARIAAVDEKEAEAFLLSRAECGDLEYSRKRISFRAE